MALQPGTGKAQMKKDISHLPESKQRELRLIVETIAAYADIELIILFGSFARGDWVEDSYVEGHTTYEYRSDYDLLVVTDTLRTSKQRAFWNRIEQRVHGHPALKTWPQLIIEDYRRIQQYLEQGHYFYADLYRSGIVLFDAGRIELPPPGELNTQQRRAQAEEDFGFWFTSGNEFFIDFSNALNRGSYRQAAFLLHQATERFYNAVLLVHTGYKAKQHDIEKLCRQVASCDPRFLSVFPQASDDQKRRLKLLKDAYIDARYNKDYQPSREDLEWLRERVEQLKQLTEQSCRERIATFA